MTSQMENELLTRVGPGTQYCRISAPIGVPGPTRVSNSFSI